ncbi:DUF4118 domain-containing protein, partial [Ligilactobacillus animalis]|uniref:DUF4118 domain-containing protein n=1 Tax=Ligilactobacillus animalis TaxID=1605 RepID=UPI003CE92F92
TRWGIWSGTLAALTAIAAADFFFFTPLYSLRVDNPQEAIDLLVFLVVALASSNLASRLRQETERLRGAWRIHRGAASPVHAAA